MRATGRVDVTASMVADHSRSADVVRLGVPDGSLGAGFPRLAAQLGDGDEYGKSGTAPEHAASDLLAESSPCPGWIKGSRCGGTAGTIEPVEDGPITSGIGPAGSERSSRSQYPLGGGKSSKRIPANFRRCDVYGVVGDLTGEEFKRRTQRSSATWRLIQRPNRRALDGRARPGWVESHPRRFLSCGSGTPG